MRRHCLELAYRLGLRPWELEDLQPIDLWEMWSGWRWRFSRDLEARMTVAVWNAMIPGKVDPVDLCRRFHDYLPDPRSEHVDA